MGARCKHTIVMKVISAYLMAVVGGNDSPSVADVKKILTSVNIELDDNDNKALEELVEELAGQDIQEVLAKGHRSSKPSQGVLPVVLLQQPRVLPQQVVMPAPQQRRSPPTMTMPLVLLSATSSVMTVVMTTKLW